MRKTSRRLAADHPDFDCLLLLFVNTLSTDVHGEGQGGGARRQADDAHELCRQVVDVYGRVFTQCY
jgi:hypothetical protein